MADTNLKEKLTNIADAIRLKTKSDNLIPFIQMYDKVKEISGEMGDICVQIIERTVTELPLDLMQGFTFIGDYAFYGCNSLRKVYLPSILTSIGDYAFYKLNSFSLDVYCYADTPPTIGVNVFNKNGLLTIHVKESSVEQYATAWSEYLGNIRGDL